MPLSANGSTRSLHEDRETRLLRAAQELHLFGRQEQSIVTEFATTGAFHMVRALRAFADAPQTQPRPLLSGLMEAFVKTCQRWRLSVQEQAVLLGYAASPVAAAELLNGRYLYMPQDVKDRIGYVVGISLGLGSLFNESVAAELDWLNRPHPKLRNQAPLAFMLRGRMAELMATSAVVAEERALR